MKKLLVVLALLASPALAQVTPGVGLYREDAASTDGIWGVLGLHVRKDTAAALCGTDGDLCPLIVDGSGRLWISGPVTQSGTWTVQPGNTANTTAWKVDGSAVTQPVSGTVTVTDGAGALNVIVDSGTVTANAGTNLNTSALALETSLAKLTQTQGSTTSGQSGPLVQGAVTTGAPTYVTGQTSPLSIDTTGALRVSGGGSTQYGEDTAHVSGDSLMLAGVIQQSADAALSTDGDRSLLQVDANGYLKVDIKAGTVTTTPPTNASTNVAQIAGTNTVTGGVAGLLAVAGNVANAGAATANPVPVGGVFTTVPATLTTGQTATLQFTAAQNAKQDVTTIAGTAPTTAGKLDVKGADGDVFVRQATAANLNAAVVGTGTAGAPAGNILTVQGVGGMTKLLVTPDSVALPANQSVDVAQIAGTTTTTDSGDATAGTQRVVSATNRISSANGDGACISVTTSTTAILASFATRKWASIVNQGSATVYVRFAATATASDFPLPAGAAFNFPAGLAYTGAIDGIAASGTQSVCVVEF